MDPKKIKILGIITIIVAGISGVILSVMVHHKELTQLDDTKDLAYPHIVDNRMATYHYPLSFISQLKGDPDAGHKIFLHYCVSCHAKNPVVAVNAPRIGVASDWIGINSYGMKTMINDTLEGNKQMPARGGCFECSDELLLQAIHYILNQNKK